MSRFVHAAAPDIRLVVLDTDLLFARAAQKWGLEGMLAIRSYPLLSRNQNYAGIHPPRRTQFASGLSEGEYNACRHMLLRAAPMPQKAARPSPPKCAQCHLREEENLPDPLCTSPETQDLKRPQDLLMDYAAPFAELGHDHRPPIWVTVLGRDGWWPVAVLNPGPNASTLHGPEPAAHPNEEFKIENASRLWCIFFWLLRLHARGTC